MRRIVIAVAIAAAIYGASALGVGLAAVRDGQHRDRRDAQRLRRLPRARSRQERGIAEEDVPQSEIKARDGGVPGGARADGGGGVPQRVPALVDCGRRVICAVVFLALAACGRASWSGRSRRSARGARRLEHGTWHGSGELEVGSQRL